MTAEMGNNFKRRVFEVDDMVCSHGKAMGRYNIPGLRISRREALRRSLDKRFDGDTSSANVVYSIEAKKEVSEFLKKRSAYVGADGKFLYDVGTDTVNIVLANCTGNPVAVKMLSYREADNATFAHHSKSYNLNKVFEQLTLDQTQPVLLKWIDDQLPKENTIDPKRLNAANTDAPILVIREGDKILLVDGRHRAAKAKSQGKKWLRAYTVTNEMLAKAKV